VFLNAAMSAALDRIAERAADARRAFTPGALPARDDVATGAPASDFTLDPLSVSAPADAYFVTGNGSGELAYTRDGAFSLSDGKLLDQRGQAVYGFGPGGDAPTELRADPVDVALGRVSDARIDPDGSFSYGRATIEPRTGATGRQRVVVGRLALARFPAGSKMAPDDAVESSGPKGAAPRIGRPKDGTFEAVVPMARDRSRVDIDRSLIRLREAYLAFDALRAAETAQLHLGKIATDLIK